MTQPIAAANTPNQPNTLNPTNTPAAPETTIPEQNSPELSLIEKMQEAQAKAEEQRRRFQLPKNTNYGDAPLEAYARLARARTAAQVQAASGYAARQISRLKAAVSSDPDNASRIKAAINQLQKAQSRARGKRRQLDKEHLLELRRKRAAQEKQRRRSEQLRYELGRRRTMRMLRENAYINEAAVDNRLQTQLAAAQQELKAQMQTVSQAYGAGQYAAAASGAETAVGTAPALNIQI